MRRYDYNVSSHLVVTAGFSLESRWDQDYEVNGGNGFTLLAQCSTMHRQIRRSFQSGIQEGPMTTYIAFLRGINVGGKNRLSMLELVGIFQALGYENVQTYIQSGNVVFSSNEKIGAKETAKIRAGILEKIGFEPSVMILSQKQLQDAVFHNPFPSNEGKALHFFFLESHSTQSNLKRLTALKNASEEYAIDDKVFYLYAPAGIGRSKLASSVERTLGVALTARNWNTVSKLASMAKKV